MSGFLNNEREYNTKTTSEIDFDDAIKLPDGGSTCDLYRTKWHRRDVFVKRLKEEFRSKPLYLDALDKEYDIGVNLHHPSLPEYREFHRDYIVIDYIDGLTLAEMVKQRDPWLRNEGNIVRMLSELVNVVEYLHRHNVVHCDIKADNIMITANNSNLILVDFDKCYTDALGDTSGDPEKYGLSVKDVGRTAIDFHAIGRLVEMLKRDVPGFKFGNWKQFVKTCYNPDATCDDLRQVLSNRGLSSRKFIRLIAVCAVVIGLVIWIGLWSGLIGKKDEPMPETKTEEVATPEVLSPPTPLNVEEGPSASSIPTALAPVSAAPETPAIKEQADLHDDARKKAEALDKRIQPEFNKLLGGLDRLQVLRKDTGASGAQLLTEIRRHGALADETITEAFAILKESSPNITDREAWRIMAYSKAYTGYTRRATLELNEVGKEIERRFAKEGKEITK